MELNSDAIKPYNGSAVNLLENQPSLELTKWLPWNLNPGAIERAVNRFMDEVDVKGDAEGFFNQTLQRIAGATTGTPNQDFWMAVDGHEVAGYALASRVVDIDGSLCYWASQAWVAPEFRHLPCVKEGYDRIFDRAKKLLCRYVILVSTRHHKAYCRFLGRGAHEYATLLKVNLP